jgi:hypothetical protein
MGAELFDLSQDSRPTVIAALNNVRRNAGEIYPELIYSDPFDCGSCPE